MSFLLALLAASTNVVSDLGTVVVEANRLDQDTTEIASAVSVLTARDIAASGAKSLPDALRHVHGLDVWHLGAGNPALAQITMRGYGENGFGRVLVVADGENLANPDMSAANYARIPVAGITRVEVLRGPQTVLHGDGASAGVINVVTDANDFKRTSYAAFHGGSYGTFGTAAGTRGGFEEQGLTYFADLSYDRSDGYRSHSGYDLWNAQAGLRQNFDNGSFLRLTSFFSDADCDLPGPLGRADYERDPQRARYADSAHRTAYGFTFSGKGVLDDENDLVFNLSFSQRRSRFDNGDYTDIYGVENHYRREYESDIYTIRFAPEWHNGTRLFGFDNRFVLGTEAKYALLLGDAHDVWRDYDYDRRESYDISRLTGGVYAQDEFFLLERLSLVVGSRLERNWNWNDVATHGNRADNLAAGEVALNWRAVDDAKVFLKWSRFYRNPFIDEYRWRSGVQSETTHPETGFSVDLGGEWNMTREFFLSGDLFYSETRDEIHFNPFALSNENSPYLHRRQGLDLAAGWEREKTAGMKIGWTGVLAEKAEGPYQGKWVPGVPRQMLNADGRLWLWDEFDVSLGLRLLGARYAISDTPNANGRLEAVTVFRCGARYRPTCRYLDGFTFAFVCENLFDETYCDYAVASVTSGANAYYPALGRSFTFTVRYDF